MDCKTCSKKSNCCVFEDIEKFTNDMKGNYSLSVKVTVNGCDEYSEE